MSMTDLLTLTFDELTPENYQQFLKIKTIPRYRFWREDDAGPHYASIPSEYADRLGIEVEIETPPLPLPLPDFLFDRQRLAVKVSWHKKTYALFWDAGLGKTLVFLELARQALALGMKPLIVSPLNVISQTIETADECYGSELWLANYHRRPQEFKKWRQEKSSVVGVINHMAFRRPVDLTGIDILFLDESSILKNPHGTLRKNLIQSTRGISRLYCFSATQAPNDRVEYAQSAMFLNMVRNDAEFRGEYFVNKEHGYVLRRHRVDGFYAFLSSWSMFMRNPERFGLENNLNLKPYKEIREEIKMLPDQRALIEQALGKSQTALPGMPENPNGFSERQVYSQVSKGFLYAGKNGNRKTIEVQSLKPEAILAFLQTRPGRKAIIWTIFDAEGDIVYRTLKEKSPLSVTHLTGKTPVEKRAALIEQFRKGDTDVIISKARLLGMGLNLHMADIMIFSGMNDSYEQYYQALKREWRYPQESTVEVYTPYTEYEKPIIDNVLGKQEEAERDFEKQEELYAKSLYDEVHAFLENDDWQPTQREEKQMHDPAITDKYEIYHTDSIEATLNGLVENRADLIVTSIPFRNDLFAYTDHIGDMGNSGGVGQAGRAEFMMHLGYSLRGMKRTLKPGRLACIEIAQSPLRLGVDGVIGISDFRGDVIRAAEEQGFIHWAEIPVLKNPQAAAIVKHIATLTMDNFNKDRINLAPMILDYILVFKKPGTNDAPVQGDDFGNFESWIEHADGVWQETEFNLGRAEYAGVSQQDRFNDYLAKYEIAFKEAMQILSGAFTDIDQTNTLNTPYTRGRTKEIEDADKHVCPFSLPLVNRLIRLYSNPGETVLDPFVGVGSVIQESIKLERFPIGIELKAEYFLQSIKVAERAVTAAQQIRMF